MPSKHSAELSYSILRRKRREASLDNFCHCLRGHHRWTNSGGPERGTVIVLRPGLYAHCHCFAKPEFFPWLAVDGSPDLFLAG